jgi:hypothetical protein
VLQWNELSSWAETLVFEYSFVPWVFIFGKLLNLSLRFLIFEIKNSLEWVFVMIKWYRKGSFCY